jgi:hypothetical protein
MQFAIAWFNAQCRPYDSAARRCIQPLVSRFFRVIDEPESLEYLSLWRSGAAVLGCEAILSGSTQFAVAGQWRAFREGVTYGIDGGSGERQ